MDDTGKSLQPLDIATSLFPATASGVASFATLPGGLDAGLAADGAAQPLEWTRLASFTAPVVAKQAQAATRVRNESDSESGGEHRKRQKRDYRRRSHSYNHKSSEGDEIADLEAALAAQSARPSLAPPRAPPSAALPAASEASSAAYLINTVPDYSNLALGASNRASTTQHACCPMPAAWAGAAATLARGWTRRCPQCQQKTHRLRLETPVLHGLLKKRSAHSLCRLQTTTRASLASIQPGPSRCRRRWSAAAKSWLTTQACNHTSSLPGCASLHSTKSLRLSTAPWEPRAAGASRLCAMRRPRGCSAARGAQATSSALIHPTPSASIRTQGTSLGAARQHALWAVR